MKIQFFKSFVPAHHTQATFIHKFMNPNYATHSVTVSVQVGQFAYVADVSWRNPKGIY